MAMSWKRQYEWLKKDYEDQFVKLNNTINKYNELVRDYNKLREEYDKLKQQKLINEFHH